VIQERDSYDIPRGLELLRHFNIGRGGLKAACGVIMGVMYL